MNILLCWVLFVVGIGLVVKGGDLFVDNATSIAHELRIPTFIIGATIVSIATTLPEMIVSAFAAAEGKVDMAIGNAVGSVTANTALILAVAMTAMSFVCKRKQYMPQMLILIAVAAILCLSCLGGTMNVFGGIVLFVIFVGFMVLNVINARAAGEADEESAPADRKTLIKNIVLFIVGAAGIVIGSRLMVDNGSEIAAWLGVPERVIAVTMIAVGTSLPELVTTITAIIKKESALSVGNIIGANIIDLSLILPICSLISGQALPVPKTSAYIDIPVCLLVTFVGLVPLIIREKSSRVQGFALLGCYAAYLAVTVL